MMSTASGYGVLPDDQALWHHMASLGHNELMQLLLNWHDW